MSSTSDATLPPYSTATGNCDGVQYCTLESHTECQQAARDLAISFPDTYSISSTTRVAGCATMANGKLRFNSFLDSGVLHPSGGGKVVLCGLCASSTSTTSSSSVTTAQPYRTAISKCDGVEYCTLDSKTECEVGATQLGIPFPNSYSISSTIRVAGCATMADGDLRFNSFLGSDVEHPSGGGKVVICGLCGPTTSSTTGSTSPTTTSSSSGGSSGTLPPYSSTTWSCDGEEYCTLPSKNECTAAATYLGISFPQAYTVSSTSKVAGCATMADGDIRFNSYLHSKGVHSPTGDRVVLCGLCEAHN